MPVIVSEEEEKQMKLREDFINSFFEKIDAVDNIESLFHYTCLDGFKGIIETNSLWATQAEYLNDCLEINYSVNIIVRALKQISNTRNYDFNFMSAIRKARVFMCASQKSRSSFKRFIPMSFKRVLFISCFSFESDKLEMWRSYGKHQGICLEFDFKQLKDVFKSSTILATYKRVVYNEDELIERIIDYIEYIYNNREIREYVCKETCYMVHLIVYLYNFIDMCKHFSFKYENEYRFSIYNYDNSKVRFRNTDSTIIPYIVAPVENNKKNLPIKSVIIGPSNNSDVLKKSIEYFLDIKGYHDIPIKISKLPYRVL